MISVTIAHPNGERQEVLLSGVPRAGEGIRLKDSDPSEPSLVVEYILWIEGGTRGHDPQVIAQVRHRPKGQ